VHSRNQRFHELHAVERCLAGEAVAVGASCCLVIDHLGLGLSRKPVRQKTAHEQLKGMIEHDRQKNESQISVRAKDQLGQRHSHSQSLFNRSSRTP